jgi:tetratricopeptide (TPR) repeat protein
MVHSYAQLKNTQQAVEQDLGVTSEDFDKQYLAWIDRRYGSEASHFDEWREKLKALAIAIREKQSTVVIAQGPVVLALYPEYVGEGNVYQVMSGAYRVKSDAKGEMAILTAYEKAGGQDPEMLKRLASLEDMAGDKAGSIATLTRVNYVYPVKDSDLHLRLGDLLYERSEYDRATREYTAAVASSPLDEAGAQFRLAKAYLAAGHRSEAENSVLSALEIAPGYVPAQKLLLELHQSSKK